MHTKFGPESITSSESEFLHDYGQNICFILCNCNSRNWDNPVCVITCLVHGVTFLVARFRLEVNEHKTPVCAENLGKQIERRELSDCACLMALTIDGDSLVLTVISLALSQQRRKLAVQDCPMPGQRSCLRLRFSVHTYERL